MRRALATGFFTLLTLLPGCRQSPALMAMQDADVAIAQAQAEAVPMYPDRFREVQAEEAEAHAKFDAGDWDAARDIALGVSGKTAVLLADSRKKRNDLLDEWNAIQNPLPKAITQLDSRLAALATTKPLPAGIDDARLAAMRSAIDAAKSDWTVARDAANKADFVTAVAKAKEASSLAGEVTKVLEGVPDK